MVEQVIKRLSEFGEEVRHHHEDYAVSSISALREKGGVLERGGLHFHFPKAFGFCYGVDKAIDMIFETCERFLTPEKAAKSQKGQRRVFLTDQLIHNPSINRKLREMGVRYLRRDRDCLLRCDNLHKGDVVVVSAFGTDFRDIENLKKKGVTIVDTTCGAIINVWKRVESYAREGFITVMHGKRHHEETRATVSQALKAGGAYIMIENKREAEELADVVRGKIREIDFIRKHRDALPERFYLESSYARMGMANQTTMLKEESLEIQEILRKAFEERFGGEGAKQRFRCFDTICGATQDRQDALKELLQKELDLILIVGGFNSSNTSHLAEIAYERLSLYHIESAGDLLSKSEIRSRCPRDGKVEVRKGWLKSQTRDIGITSGASTPDVVLSDAIQRILDLR